MDEREEFELENEDQNEEFEEERNEEESEESKDVEMAPVDLIKRIKFFLNKENRKDKYIYFPVPLKKLFTRYVLIAIALVGTGIFMCFVYRPDLMLLVPAALALFCGIMAYRTYLIGACRQYIEIKGEVVKSDYQDNQAQYYRAAAKRMTRADFNYRNFTLQRDDETEDDRLIVVSCKTYKDLPREGETVRVLMNMQTIVDEMPNEIIVRDYIGIEKTVA